MTRIINCPECGGSGYRAGTYGDIECFDCSGEGQWEEEPRDALAEAVERDLRFTIEMQNRKAA